MTVFLLEEIKQNIYLQRFVLVICLMEEYSLILFANSKLFGKDTDL